MTETPSSDRSADRIVAIARTWIGTPYRHQASARLTGVDCIGLIRGVWREFYGSDEPEPVPTYTRDWAETNGTELLMGFADKYLVRRDHRPLISGADFTQGGVVLMRMMPRGPAKHVAITIKPHGMIHSYSRHRVQEIDVPDDWRRKIAAAYTFPGVT